MGDLTGSREPSPSVLALSGVDPDRGPWIWYRGEIRHSESGDWTKVTNETTEAEAASWAAAHCISDNDEWRVVRVIEEEVSRG